MIHEEDWDVTITDIYVVCRQCLHHVKKLRLDQTTRNTSNHPAKEHDGNRLSTVFSRVLLIAKTQCFKLPREALNDLDSEGSTSRSIALIVDLPKSSRMMLGVRG